MEKYSWSMQQPKQHGNLKLPVSEASPVGKKRLIVIFFFVCHNFNSRFEKCEFQVRAELPPSEEDWETEATVTRSYDPKAKAEKMQVVKKKQIIKPGFLGFNLTTNLVPCFSEAWWDFVHHGKL